MYMKHLKKTVNLESNYIVYYDSPESLKEWLTKKGFHYTLRYEGINKKNNNGIKKEFSYALIIAGEMTFFACKSEFQSLSMFRDGHIQFIKESFFKIPVTTWIDIACDQEELDYFFEFSNKIYTRPGIFQKVDQKKLEKEIWENLEKA